MADGRRAQATALARAAAGELRLLLTMARTTYYGAHDLLWRALLTMARTTYYGAHYLLWQASCTH